jgi:hypothetical protein
MDLLRGQEREAFPERKPGLRSKDGAGAGTRAVGLGSTFLKDEAKEVVVLLHEPIW